MTEAELQTQIADYLRLKYSNVLFHSDFGSGIKLTIGQATKQKRQNGGRRAWPDMFIAEAVIYYKTAMICESQGIDAAMKYFTSTHTEDEYQEYRTSVIGAEKWA